MSDHFTGGTKIAKLLWLDDEFVSEHALHDALGDRYLYASNSMFARVRTLFLENGFRYSFEATRMWRDYGTMPLLMLQEILDAGLVPYKDNATTLRMISSRSPTLEMPISHLLALLSRNYLLHESAHCIAYRLLSCDLDQSNEHQADKDKYVYVCILCEAYANLVERLAAAEATSDAHRFFFTVNSFVECREDVCSLLRDSVRILGLTQTFFIGMLTFYYLNTHDENPGDQVAETIIDTTFAGRSLSDAGRGLAKALINQGFGLHQRFRTETTPLFFRYVGCENEWQSLCQRPFDQETLRVTHVVDAVSRLSRATCRDLAFDVKLPPVGEKSGIFSQA